jgi:putative transposase
MANAHSGNGAFGEYTIRNEIDFERHVDYVHFNPVKDQLAGRAREWPYS